MSKEILLEIVFTREFNILLAGLLCVLVAGVIVISYRRKRDNCLSSRLKVELSKSCKPEPGPIFIREWLEQLYLPSWQSVLTVLSVGAVLFWLSHDDRFGLNFSNLPFISNDHYQNLIAIHAGVGAIIFALLIFIAESLRDDETKDRARVLLRESFLFPLTVAEIVGFFIFIWGDVNIWATLPLIVVAILTIASLWRLLSVLLSRARFSKKRLQLLKDRVKKSIDLAISERIGNSILLNSLGEDKIELDYYPLSFDADERSTHHVFYVDKVGVVTDIRLDKLSEFAKIVEVEANKNGFSFYENKARPVPSDPDNASVREGVVEKFTQAKQQYLNKRFKDVIEEDNQIVLAVEKRTVSDADTLNKLSLLAKEIFTIKKQENFSEEVKLEINGLTDQFIAAIEEKKLGKIEELVRTYAGLADSFLEAINACGGGYSYEQARKERSSLFGGWNEVRWLSDSIREIVVKATQTHDRDIIREVAYLPVHIATKAIKFGDQYVYQEFLAFPSLLYWLSEQEEKDDVRKFMVDRSWRHLKEMSDYYIEHQLKRKASDAESIERYKEFTIPIFSAFQNLLKTAFDKRNLNDFKEFISHFSSLYNNFEEDIRFPRAEHLRFDLERTTDPKLKKDLERKIEIQEAREEAAKDIAEKKRQVIFGITSWIFEKYRNNNTDTLLANFYTESVSRLPNTLPELTSLFISSRTFETEHFWDWDNWEIIPDAGVQSIDFHSKLDRLFCVRALNILASISEENIDAIELPHSRDLAFQADENPNNRSLFNVLDSIASDPNDWNFVLTEAAISRVPQLKELLKKARDAQETTEEEFLETAELDKDKLVEFNTKIKETFHQSAYLRPVINQYGVYNDLTDEAPNDRGTMWGYNQVDRKEAFIKDWHVHYVGWGENYGRGMAHSEDEIIFENITNSVQLTRDVEKDRVISEIESIISSSAFEKPIVIQTLDRLYEYEQIRRSDAFIDRYRECPKTGLENTPGYMGVLKFGERIVPVVDLFVRKDSLKKKAVVVELEKFGELNQYSPIEKDEDADYKNGIFLSKVSDLNKDDAKRNKILTDDPSWLQEHSNKEEYLRRQVLINIYERFDFSVKNPEAAILLNITDLDENDVEESAEG